MSVTTEELHHLAAGIDSRPAIDVASVLVDGQISAAQSVKAAIEPIAMASHAMAQSIRDGGTLYYVAAGSSGLMGAADAMELGGTFGISTGQIRIVMAGGVPATAHMPGDTEDATTELDAGLAELSATDTVITISASGSTPFTLEAARRGVSVGANVIAVANNADAPLFELSDHPIFLPTPPEVLSGSTRLGAGTAQKIALNMMSTLMAMELGHIYDGMMVNLRADNIKLRERARRIISEITKASDLEAMKALEAASGNVKLATLLAAGAGNVEQAMTLLEISNGQLRPALEQIRTEIRV
ncbi:MAG: N-acetylmuramic acid 6-phosphate etherase [Roseibium sp.]